VVTSFEGGMLLKLNTEKEYKGQFHQHVYAKLLCAQISKRKNSVKLSVPFLLLRSACVKAVRKMLMILTPGFFFLRNQNKNKIKNFK